MKNQFLVAVMLFAVAPVVNATLYYAKIINVDIYSAGNFGMDAVYEYSTAPGGGGDPDGGLAGAQFKTPLPPIPGVTAYAPGNLFYNDVTGVFTWSNDLIMLGGAAEHDVVLSDGTIDTNTIVGQDNSGDSSIGTNSITSGSAVCIDNSSYGACGPSGWSASSWSWNDLTVVGSGVGAIYKFSDTSDWNDLDDQLAVRAQELADFGVAFTNATAMQDSTYHYRMNIEIVAVAVPIPAAAWLFASALLGLVGMGRRRAAK
ncbi:hypothetical protein [Oceanicoccus sp. KOV_DT_Chl]|uniref:hypothetical protein n=1 Tax=Oceanicoccus sp. KOV_DT_Chl TaxID=1904639 RepID=UPI00190ECFCA|nr:hypothetical protein [Oceanicoccus sp. KOV_DT_Chl]